MAFVPRDPQRRDELGAFTRKVFIVIGVILLLAVLWAARHVLLLIFIAAVLAAGIAPAVHRVRVVGRHLFHRNIPRGTAVLIVYFPFVVLVLLLLIVIVPRVIVETRSLGAQLPALIDRNLLTPLDRFVPMGGARAYIREHGLMLPRASVVLYVRNAVAAIGSFVAVLFMVVYMLIDANRLRNLILLIYPPEQRAQRRKMLNRIGRRMSSWLAAQLILSGIIGVATFVGLLLLRVPYALPLAIFATFGEMVPVIGPIVGTSPALVLALLHSKWQFWSVLAMVLILQKVENLFIGPRVMSRKVSISPLTAFVAFMIGASVFGIVGALMAIPMTAVLQVGFEEAFVSRRERRQDVERAGTLWKRRD
jgi:predicted PurR-regulated permease PerM